eukprot:6187508-Pleurochrysis_carterae.AAC.2
MLAKIEAKSVEQNIVAPEVGDHPVREEICVFASDVMPSNAPLRAAARRMVGAAPRQSVRKPSSLATRTQQSIELA